jgi:Na+/phosphate symporter
MKWGLRESTWNVTSHQTINVSCCLVFIWLTDVLVGFICDVSADERGGTQLVGSLG